MKKNYVIPRTTSVDVVTENAFALGVSNVTGQGSDGRGGYLMIGDGGDGSDGEAAPDPTAKGGFWDV
jgi:hypothetical protein